MQKGLPAGSPGAREAHRGSAVLRLHEMGKSLYRSWDFGLKGALRLSLAACRLLPPWDIYLALKVSKGLSDAEHLAGPCCVTTHAFP